MNTKFNDEILAAEGIARDSKDMPLNWAIQYLRAYLNRTDLANVLATQGENDFDLQIERIRNLISAGSYERAASGLRQMSAGNAYQSGEYAIEMARVLHYSGDYVECTSLCDQTLTHLPLNPVSRATLMQIRGVSHLCLQDYESALRDLEHVASCAPLFPYSKAILCAVAHLVWIHCQRDNHEQALRSLKQLNQNLDLISDNRSIWISRMLFYIRAQLHFERTFGSAPLANSLLVDSFLLAQWLKDDETEKKCKGELSNMGFELILHEKWYWIESQKIVLWKDTTAFTQLTMSPLLCKLIEVLRTGPKTFASLFEATWGLRYDDRHEKTLRSTLSKLRKALPEGALIVKDSIVFLS